MAAELTLRRTIGGPCAWFATCLALCCLHPRRFRDDNSIPEPREAIADVGEDNEGYMPTRPYPVADRIASSKTRAYGYDTNEQKRNDLVNQTRLTCKQNRWAFSPLSRLFQSDSLHEW